MTRRGASRSPPRAARSRAAAILLRRRLGRHLRPHLFLLPSLGVTFGVLFWLVTAGTGALFGVESFGQFYDAQARSLVAGHWDVPPDAIGFEAFERDGRTYGYFGPAPALLHLLPAMVFPAADGRWSRTSMLLAAAVSIVSAYRLLLSARRGMSSAGGRPAAAVPRDRRTRRAYGWFVIVVGIGSTLAFVASRAYVYHEAIAWGAALALVCYDHVVRYLTGGRLTNLSVACAAAVLAFFSRGTAGAGAVAAVALVAAAIAARGLRRPADARWRHAAVAVAAVVGVVGLFVTINHAKFRTPFEAAPLRMYRLVRDSPARMARTGGQIMNWRNVRTTAAAYASPLNVEFDCGVPWVFPTWTTTVYPEARLDQVETFVGLPVIAPGLLVLAAVGLVATAAGRGGGRTCGKWAAAAIIPTAAALAGGGLVLTANAVTFRYMHDFYPALVVSAAFGLPAVLAVPGRRGKAVRAAGVAVAIVGLGSNLAVTVAFQRMIMWGVPGEAEVSFRSFRVLAAAVMGCGDQRAGPPGYDRRWRPPPFPGAPPGNPDQRVRAAPAAGP